MPYRAVLLDVDGTLVDSNDAHAHAWVDALAESGRRVDFLRARPLVGMAPTRSCRRSAIRRMTSPPETIWGLR